MISSFGSVKLGYIFFMHAVSWGPCALLKWIFLLPKDVFGELSCTALIREARDFKIVLLKEHQYSQRT